MDGRSPDPHGGSATIDHKSVFPKRLVRTPSTYLRTFARGVYHTTTTHGNIGTDVSISYEIPARPLYTRTDWCMVPIYVAVTLSNQKNALLCPPARPRVKRCRCRVEVGDGLYTGTGGK